MNKHISEKSTLYVIVSIKHCLVFVMSIKRTLAHGSAHWARGREPEPWTTTEKPKLEFTKE